MTDDEVQMNSLIKYFLHIFLQILLLSMLDMNAPKMTAQDLPLFQNIVEDLFPGINIPKIDYTKVLIDFLIYFFF